MNLATWRLRGQPDRIFNWSHATLEFSDLETAGATGLQGGATPRHAGI